MKLYNIKDIKNGHITSFHELIRLAHQHTQATGILSPEEYLVINLFIEGGAHYKSDSMESIVEANQITVTQPGEEHQLILPPGNEQCTLIYTPQYVSNVISTLTHSDAFSLDNPETPQNIPVRFDTLIHVDKWETVQLMKKIHSLMEEQNKDAELALLGNICFQETLLSLLRNEYILRIQRKLEDTQPSIGVKEELQKRIQKAIEYINDHYAEDITLDQLAKISNMSKYHFSRTFKQLVHQTPYQYVAHNRIKRAKLLLNTTSLTISEIAFNLGFANLPAFDKFFHKMTGITPSQFRNNDSQT